jgi:hypothetical protein
MDLAAEALVNILVVRGHSIFPFPNAYFLPDYQRPVSPA